MKIKEYDLVKFHQGVYRVMAITRPTTVKISTYGPVHINSVELVEKASIPSLSVGDCVIINDIPKSEKSYYPTGWDDEMTQMAKSGKVFEVEYNDWSDDTYRIGKFWFAPYHLEKVLDYDII